jgi:hypothetical protein
VALLVLGAAVALVVAGLLVLEAELVLLGVSLLTVGLFVDLVTGVDALLVEVVALG